MNFIINFIALLSVTFILNIFIPVPIYSLFFLYIGANSFIEFSLLMLLFLLNYKDYYLQSSYRKKYAIIVAIGLLSIVIHSLILYIILGTSNTAIAGSFSIILLVGIGFYLIAPLLFIQLFKFFPFKMNASVAKWVTRFFYAVLLIAFITMSIVDKNFLSGMFFLVAILFESFPLLYIIVIALSLFYAYRIAVANKNIYKKVLLSLLLVSLSVTSYLIMPTQIYIKGKAIHEETKMPVKNVDLGFECGNDMFGSSFYATTNDDGEFGMFLDKKECFRFFRVMHWNYKEYDVSSEAPTPNHKNIRVIFKKKAKSVEVTQTPKPESKKVQIIQSVSKEDALRVIHDYINKKDGEYAKDFQIQELKHNRDYYVAFVGDSSIFIYYKGRPYCASGGCSASLIEIDDKGEIFEKASFTGVRPPLRILKESSKEGFSKVIIPVTYIGDSQAWETYYNVFTPYEVEGYRDTGASKIYREGDKEFIEIKKILEEKREIIELFKKKK